MDIPTVIPGIQISGYYCIENIQKSRDYGCLLLLDTTVLHKTVNISKVYIIFNWRTVTCFKISFWAVMLCSLTDGHKIFGGMSFLDLKESSTQKSDVTSSSKTLASIYQTTQCHIQEDHYPDTHCQENLKSHSHLLTIWNNSW